ELLKYLSSELTIPITASGGAGTKEHFVEAFTEANVDACLAASLFHYKELEISALKNYLHKNKINVRL
ncbi:MAG: imidazole glycerol phosphate synthase subunit HisF, partial [Ignavibacteriae bacterium]|nr:imidazole glycerol phosphate synthase subunit HisF [Ignavibacteriota bacterium]